ncbi:MAG: VTT domain-containing protein [Sphaerochaetaceae bacterium]|nr:VTT domain-containing protein [Sphaerochaetaceae bacterium]MDC7247341.1 VTT domain-containing protein [Sphaerochaetaceae bacterium]
MIAKGNRKKLVFKKSYFTEEGELDWSVIVRRTVVFLSIFVALFLTVFAFLRPQMESIARTVTVDLGYPGLFLFTLFVDMFIVPFSVDVVFPFAFEFDPVIFLAVISFASAIAGIGGYWIGRLLGHLSIVRTITGGFSEDGERLIKKYGTWAIVIAGLTPIPFSTVCWISGMVHVDFSKVPLACLSRIPRMILYYYALKGGLRLLF